MKKTYYYLFIAALFISTACLAQKPFKFDKVRKDVKKEAKKYEKEDWKPFPGNMPISQQLNDAFAKMNETNDEGFPQWLIANGSSVAQSQSAAEMQAIELAKTRMIGLIESNMKSVVESDVSNNQIDAMEAASITKTIEVSANRVSKKLGMIQPLFKIYRSVGKNTEVQVMLGYSYDMARKQMIEEMKLELQNGEDDMRKRYEQFLNPENYNRGLIVNATN